MLRESKSTATLFVSLDPDLTPGHFLSTSYTYTLYPTPHTLHPTPHTILKPSPCITLSDWYEVSLGLG